VEAVLFVAVRGESKEGPAIHLQLLEPVGEAVLRYYPIVASRKGSNPSWQFVDSRREAACSFVVRGGHYRRSQPHLQHCGVSIGRANLYYSQETLKKGPVPSPKHCRINSTVYDIK